MPAPMCARCEKTRPWAMRTTLGRCRFGNTFIPRTAGNETISGRCARDEAVSNSRFPTGAAPSKCLKADREEYNFGQVLSA